jgi:hypothetical protein
MTKPRIYVKEYRPGSHVTLHEMTEGEWLKAMEANLGEDTTSYRRVSAAEAHRWVRQGGLHTTPLWVDGWRVCYAAASE